MTNSTHGKRLILMILMSAAALISAYLAPRFILPLVPGILFYAIDHLLRPNEVLSPESEIEKTLHFMLAILFVVNLLFGAYLYLTPNFDVLQYFKSAITSSDVNLREFGFVATNIIAIFFLYLVCGNSAHRNHELTLVELSKRNRRELRRFVNPPLFFLAMIVGAHFILPNSTLTTIREICLYVTLLMCGYLLIPILADVFLAARRTAK